MYENKINQGPFPTWEGVVKVHDENLYILALFHCPGLPLEWRLLPECENPYRQGPIGVGRRGARSLEEPDRLYLHLSDRSVQECTAGPTGGRDHSGEQAFGEMPLRHGIFPGLQWEQDNHPSQKWQGPSRADLYRDRPGYRWGAGPATGGQHFGKGHGQWDPNGL